MMLFGEASFHGPFHFIRLNTARFSSTFVEHVSLQASPSSRSLIVWRSRPRMSASVSRANGVWTSSKSTPSARLLASRSMNLFGNITSCCKACPTTEPRRGFNPDSGSQKLELQIPRFDDRGIVSTKVSIRCDEVSSTCFRGIRLGDRTYCHSLTRRP